MGDSNRTCPSCQRPPRGQHADTCPRARPGIGQRAARLEREHREQQALALEAAFKEERRKNLVVREALEELRNKLRNEKQDGIEA